MTWLEHHRESERFAADAEIAERRGSSLEAQRLYSQAAQAEERALGDLDQSKARTYGISAVSTVALYFKATQLGDAEAIAHRALAWKQLPEFAREQLRSLLQSVWSEQVRERAGVGFAPGQVLISVKGGEIVEGGAPLDLVVEKVQTVQSLFYRTTELLKDLPHRKRGGPSKAIQESCRPWLFQAAPGSYQFAVAVQEPKQPDLFRSDEPRPEQIADQFLRILRASVDSPGGDLPNIVPNPEYRATFLKLARNLAPTGRRFSQLEVRAADETTSLTLSPATRGAVTAAIRSSRPSVAGPETEETVSGVLRALHLDEDWLEVTVGTDHLRVHQVGDAVDDVIGPMVNHSVIVRIVRDARGTLHCRDIEPDE